MSTSTRRNCTGPLPAGTLGRLLVAREISRGEAILLAPTFTGTVVMEPPVDDMTPFVRQLPPTIIDLTHFADRIPTAAERLRLNEIARDWPAWTDRVEDVRS